jgi:hypothetical protein
VEHYATTARCPDSDCDSRAEPQEELAEGGMLGYWACTECGLEFGHSIVKDEAAAGTCSLGVPESVRRKASVPVPDNQAHVFLGRTIGRRPGA